MGVVAGQQLGPGRALCGVYGRTFTDSDHSLKTYCVPGTVLGREERPESCAVPSERLWLARGSRVQQICARQCSPCGRNRAPKGPADNRNNSLFMKHLLCARRSSKRFLKIGHFIFPPPSELSSYLHTLQRRQPGRLKLGWLVELSFELEGLTSEPVLFPHQPWGVPEVFLETECPVPRGSRRKGLARQRNGDVGA